MIESKLNDLTMICCMVKGRIKGQNCAFASDTAHFCDRKCAVSTKRPSLIITIDHNLKFSLHCLAS